MEKPVQEILAPSVKGFLGILPGHAPLITLLKAGLLKYLPENSTKWEKLALGWGFLEVYFGGVRILAESAETKETLDRVETKKEISEIQKQIDQKDIAPSEREKLEKQKLWLESQLEL